jgi:BASS family bile acid:Na+ symporter
MLVVRKVCLGLAAAGLIGAIVGLALGTPSLWQLASVMAAVGLAIGLGAVPALKGYQYTAWILAAVVVAMIFPAAFLKWGDLDLRNKWLVLVVVQLVMFGMGTQMSLKDFVGVMKMPWGVVVAVGCQFLVMPLTGYVLTQILPLPDEIAAGVILIGSCSSGLASNVMCFIARANLALSITATSITTLIAPIMTPLWMKVLAGRLVEIQFLGMMTEIIKIVIVPIGAALIHDFLERATPAGRRIVFTLVALAVAWLVGLALGVWTWLSTQLGPSALLWIELGSFAGGAVVFGSIYHAVVTRFEAVGRFMPVVSMAGIVYFTTVTTAAGRENLLLVGGVLVLVAILHNSAGYFFGYWLARLCRLDGPSCRTVAIEVGLQNGGMASGLAAGMGKLATVGLASAVFSPWMNISGSILANYWRKRPCSDLRNAA